MENIQNLLERIVSQVFEVNAFIFVAPPGEDDAPADESGIPVIALIEWSQGDWQLQLKAFTPLCLSIAANMTGSAPDDPHVQEASEDALAEMANMIMGNLLAECMGRYDQRQLGLPVICLMPPEQREPPVLDFKLMADGEFPLQVTLNVRPGAAGDPRN